MSIYREISKKIGWDKDTKVSIPTLEEARELHNDVLIDESVEAYENVFRIHRFAPTPDCGEDEQAMKWIHEAYVYGQSLFK